MNFCLTNGLLNYEFIGFFHMLNTILDIDECAKNNGGCDANANCTNTNGSFTCKCNNGYTGDGIKCEGKPYILITLPNKL